MSQDIFGVEPGSEDYSHEVLLLSRGKKFGLKLLNGVSSVHIIPPARQAPPFKLEQNSWQNGRGAEVWLPNAMNFYDAQNAWTSTPNKLHPTLLMQWYTGFRDAEMNMPQAGDTHKWLPLYAGSGSDPNRRYQSVSFTASASSNRERCFLIIRKRGKPGTLTVEWCSDSSGSPGTVQKTVTKAYSDLGDVVSYYIEFKPSSVLAVTSAAVYHIKIYGASGDTLNDCWEVMCDSAASGKNSSDNSSWSATAYSPYYRITDEDVSQFIFPFAFDGAWYAVTSRLDRGNSKLYIHGCRGKATAGASTTLTDSGAGQYGGTWTTDMWANYKVRIIRGTGQGQVRTISSNTGTVLTVSSAWHINPDTTSEYYIYGGKAWKEISVTGNLAWVPAKPAYANGTVYFPQGDTADIRIMQLNYANANDHGFDTENTKHNQAWFLVPSYDSSLGPVMVRGNETATSAGTPAGKAVSVGRAPTSPDGTPVSFGTDLTFQTSILVGDNTYRISGVYNHQNQLWVAKEDTLYQITGNVPVEFRYGADASPNIMNGVAGCTGMDGQFYIAAEHDIFLISGGNTYPTNLPHNLPSGRGGYVRDMISEKGWLFAALDAGDSGWSSIMRMTLQDRSWHEQVRTFAVGRRIRNLAWLNHVDTRSHLTWECAGELMYQEMPLFGVRPIQDSGCAYQHEAVIELPTMDMLNTDPKYFSYFALDSKKLASATTAAVYGREIALDYQLNDNIGTSAWVNGGSFGKSPQDKVTLNLGSKYKIRPRLRIESNEASNPPIVENMGLSLFTRTKQYSSVMMEVNAYGEEEISGEEIWQAIIGMVIAAETVNVESIFSFLHNKRVILPAEPNVNITNINPEVGFDGVFQLYMEFLPE